MELKDIENLANLCRIQLSDEEKKSLGQDLNHILKYIEEISEAKIEEVEASYILKNALREDKNPHLPGAYTDVLLAESQSVRGNLIKVKKVL